MNTIIIRNFWTGIIAKTLCALAAMAMAVLLLTAWTYEKEEREITENARNLACIQRLYNLSLDNGLIRDISRGETEAAKQQLSMRMANSLALLRPEMEMADEDEREFVKLAFSRLLSEEREQPNLYLNASSALRRIETKAWEDAGRELLATNQPTQNQRSAEIFRISQK